MVENVVVTLVLLAIGITGVTLALRAHIPGLARALGWLIIILAAVGAAVVIVDISVNLP